ncbi:MAG: hypothetical protein ABIS23_03510, partial [Sphingomicrobium sp.]
LLALKPFGIALCLLSIFGWVLALLLARYMTSDLQSTLAFASTVSEAKWGSLAFSFVALLTWMLVIGDDWVREAADHYAVALLGSCDAPKVPIA